jgi:hypothetical protein
MCAPIGHEPRNHPLDAIREFHLPGPGNRNLDYFAVVELVT